MKHFPKEAIMLCFVGHKGCMEMSWRSCVYGSWLLLCSLTRCAGWPTSQSDACQFLLKYWK